MASKSPLRYPGGKSRAVKFIQQYIPKEETKLCSPFLGGGSVELALSERMQVHVADIFEPLICFWKFLLNRPEDLAGKISMYYPMSRTEFYQLQQGYANFEDELDRAAVFYVLNRCSFSGSTLSGGMSPNHPRFNQAAIDRVRNFKAQNIEVDHYDFCEFIPKHPDKFLYCDPPYLNGQALYGINGGSHKGFDHKALSNILHIRDRWLLSYNDCEDIRQLYQGYKIISAAWSYGMGNKKQSSEILISSEKI